VNVGDQRTGCRDAIRCVEDRLHQGRTLVMGVLNVTPDSFSDGGRYLEPETARCRAIEMAGDGADIIDIGGESSRPGADPLSASEELGRIERVVPAVCSAGFAVSIDTYKAEVARWAVRCGAAVVNDITGLRGDPAMADVVAEAGCYLVIMHMLGTPRTMQTAPQYADVVDDLKCFFEERIEYATTRGIEHDRILLDPGIGFGKTVDHNLELLRRLNEFTALGCPILVGPSRKSFIGAVLGLDVGDRLEGTAGAVVCAVMNGAHVVRVHDVREMARVVKMVDAVMGRRAGVVVTG